MRLQARDTQQPLSIWHRTDIAYQTPDSMQEVIKCAVVAWSARYADKASSFGWANAAMRTPRLI